MSLQKVKVIKNKQTKIDEYPFTIPTIRSLDEIELTNPVTFFVGENGSGKSTLLEAIADKSEFNTAGGGRNNIFEVHASKSALGKYLRLSWLPKIMNGFFLRAETFYDFATHLDEVDDTGFKDYGGQSLHKQSHGESFFSLFLHRFKGDSIYLLDEPEAALSPQKQFAFLRIIHDLVTEENVQFIIATHSPILSAYPNADIFSFDHDKIKKIKYEETEHYKLTKYFLNNTDRMLNELFKDD